MHGALKGTSNCIGPTFGCAIESKPSAVVVLRILAAVDGHFLVVPCFILLCSLQFGQVLQWLW